MVGLGNSTVGPRLALGIEQGSAFSSSLDLLFFLGEPVAVVGEPDTSTDFFDW